MSIDEIFAQLNTQLGQYDLNNHDDYHTIVTTLIEHIQNLHNSVYFMYLTLQVTCDIHEDKCPHPHNSRELIAVLNEHSQLARDTAQHAYNQAQHVLNNAQE